MKMHNPNLIFFHSRSQFVMEQNCSIDSSPLKNGENCVNYRQENQSCNSQRKGKYLTLHKASQCILFMCVREGSAKKVFFSNL